MADEPSNADVLNVLFEGMPEDERAILCSVAGDPNKVERWPGVPWYLGQRCPIDTGFNNYVAISGFHVNENGSWRRRKDQFGALYVVMIDDIGTGSGSKIHPSKISNKVIPTLLVETSPGNYQATFKLREPIRSFVEADDLIRGLIQGVADGGVDPGMAGVTRVLRLPGGINGKPKYQTADGEPWRCRVARWRPNERVDLDEFRRVFNVVSAPRLYYAPTDASAEERKRGFAITMKCLELLGRVKKRGRGWADIRCPWINEHSDRGDTGTAVAYPDNSNSYFGGFKCHHGHCQQRSMGDLEDWVVEEMIKHGRATRGPFRR